MFKENFLVIAVYYSLSIKTRGLLSWILWKSLVSVIFNKKSLVNCKYTRAVWKGSLRNLKEHVVYSRQCFLFWLNWTLLDESYLKSPGSLLPAAWPHYYPPTDQQKVLQVLEFCLRLIHSFAELLSTSLHWLFPLDVL